MESTPTSTLFNLTKTLAAPSKPSTSNLQRHLSRSRLHQSLQHRLISSRIKCFRNRDFQKSFEFAANCPSAPVISLRNLYLPPPISSRLACISNSSASFASGGGSDGFSGGNNGGGGGGDGGGEIETKSVAAGSEDVSALSPDVIILDVGGMTCGGCAASVKRILESQPNVSSANVNLATETAIVWPVPEAKVMQNWQQQLGETLAKHLTNCGFQSNPRESTRDSYFKVFEKKMAEKHKRLKESGKDLVVSWTLCAVCLVGHLSHFFGTSAPWIHALHSTGFHLTLSLFTLLGPGRQLIFDGLKSLLRGVPNMNTLVGLGALSSFAVSSIAALIPKLGWKTFFEEPVMLIAFVLLGRNLEQRAKLKASSDMTGLLSILPSKARLIIKEGAGDSDSIVEVPVTVSQ